MAIKTGALLCDLTQSYAPVGGGGIGTYLRQKRDYVLAHSDYRLVQIVPGACDRVIENGRHVWVEIGAEQVRGSPNYRFITRTSAVRAVLDQYRPQIIESQCPWVLPWTAINYRRAHPATALVAGYHTDFPNTHVYRRITVTRAKTPKLTSAMLGVTLGEWHAWLAWSSPEFLTT